VLFPVLNSSRNSIFIGFYSIGTGSNYLITKDGKAGGEKPNFQPLQKDFEVLGTSSNTQMQIMIHKMAPF